MKTPVILAIVAAAGIAIYYFQGDKIAQRPTPDSPAGAPIVDVKMPETLDPAAKVGQAIFKANCAACHGENAGGQEGTAPPLVHKIYEPSHHGDEAFQRAAASGVQSHHWRFGNMPPVEGLTRADVSQIIAYVRSLQRANGIN